MSKRLSKPVAAPVVEIYGKRQPQRPHYLGALLELHNIDRAKIIEELGIDKSVVSRWLADERPTTPGLKWAKKLGWYFAISDDPDDFVDIFTDPAVARFQRLTKGRSLDEINRMLNTLEAAFSVRKTGT